MREYRADELHFTGMFKGQGPQAGEAEALVKKYHYSHRPPGTIYFVGALHEPGGLFGDQGEMIAAVYFSPPPSRWSENVIELTRLVRKDEVRVPLSRLIALSCNELKRKGVPLLVSFADRTQGHEGYVYRACSWNYAGMRDPRMDGVYIGGTLIPVRTCNALYGTSSIERLREIHAGKEVEPHMDEGKHLYWRALNKEGKRRAARLNLTCEEYPKNDDDTGPGDEPS